ncbi:hypothetical protein [Pseudomonas sp. TH31]|uniref:hypothetical protein n=1 Tax=Pseudomonas sp. TH31 TaxID=2796396 RepID=UPI001A924B3F|nr:hypothetical protein [Pseudomonas sp. TH31]
MIFTDFSIVENQDQKIKRSQPSAAPTGVSVWRLRRDFNGAGFFQERVRQSSTASRTPAYIDSTPVGAAEGCDLLIFTDFSIVENQDQKIAAFGSSTGVSGWRLRRDFNGSGFFHERVRQNSTASRTPAYID